MREILFRGKTVDNYKTKKNKWVYGVYFKDELDYSWIINNGNDNDGMFILVDENTVGQYSYVKDRNGTKVFEDDIVKLTCYDDDNPPFAIMIFDEEERMFKLAYNTGETSPDEFEEEFIEVVGNIWDNPELAEQIEGQHKKEVEEYWRDVIGITNMM